MKRQLQRALTIAFIWTLYGFFAASQQRMASYGAMLEPWSRALRIAFSDALPWALLTPIAFWIAGKCLVRRATLWWAIPALFICGTFMGVVHLRAFVGLQRWLGLLQNGQATGAVSRTKLLPDILLAWILFAFRHGIEYYRRYQAREVAASRLQAQLTRAQMEALRAQLQPHFLFNTLHAISALMYRDVESADRMMSRLSDFLRLTLDSSGVQEVTLKREMEYLDKYLEIEQVRFGARMVVRRSIDPRTLDLLVPNLMLQPLVENAVRYGIAPRASGGNIEIAAALSGARLSLEVRDDGRGAELVTEGIGISNTRARLEQLYGSRAKLELGNLPRRAGEGGGFRARIELPAHTEPMDASADR